MWESQTKMGAVVSSEGEWSESPASPEVVSDVSVALLEGVAADIAKDFEVSMVHAERVTSLLAASGVLDLGALLEMYKRQVPEFASTAQPPLREKREREEEEEDVEALEMYEELEKATKRPRLEIPEGVPLPAVPSRLREWRVLEPQTRGVTSLAELPPELVEQLLGFLDPKQRLVAARTARAFADFAHRSFDPQSETGRAALRVAIKSGNMRLLNVAAQKENWDPFPLVTTPPYRDPSLDVAALASMGVPAEQLERWGEPTIWRDYAFLRDAVTHKQPGILRMLLAHPSIDFSAPDVFLEHRVMAGYPPLTLGYGLVDSVTRPAVPELVEVVMEHPDLRTVRNALSVAYALPSKLRGGQILLTSITEHAKEMPWAQVIEVFDAAVYLDNLALINKIEELWPESFSKQNLEHEIIRALGYERNIAAYHLLRRYGEPTGKEVFVEAAAEAGNVEAVQDLLAGDFSPVPGMALYKAVQSGSIETVRRLLQDPRVTPMAQGRAAMKQAVSKNRPDMLALMLQHPGFPARTSFGAELREAGARPGGGSELVRLILEHPTSGNIKLADVQFAFNQSLRSENFDAAALILNKRPEVDPGFQGHLAVRKAASAGATRFVRALLADPRVNPTAKNNEPIRNAIQERHFHTARVLFRDRRVRSSLTPREIEKIRKEIEK